MYYQALRDGTVFMGIGAWYKYANQLGIRRKFFKLNRNTNIGLKASNPLNILHMDVTIFRPLDQTKTYIYFIVDNFSRAILGWRCSMEYSSEIALRLLKSVIHVHDIKPGTQLITDGGPENIGEVSGFTAENPCINQLIAKKDIIQSNSMVEAVNKHMKYYYLFRKGLADSEAVTLHLKDSVEDYNNKPHGKLHGFTPQEVLEGAVPLANQFQQAIDTARKARIVQNQQVKCCRG